MKIDATSLANDVRERLWGDRFPIDPVTICRKLGIQIFEAELPPKVSGALMKERGKDPQIIVHHEDSDNRKRFTAAHELGHFVSRLNNGAADDEEYEYVDLRSPDSAAGKDPGEIFANQFAAALLMPADELLRRHRDGLSAVSLAAYFGVSGEAIAFRLQNLRVSPTLSAAIG